MKKNIYTSEEIQIIRFHFRLFFCFYFLEPRKNIKTPSGTRSE